MPGGNRTGPLGFGPRTGRGMGYCAGYNMPGYTNPGAGFGRGRGMGFGRGRGFGWRAFSPLPGPAPYYGPAYPDYSYPQPSPDEEKTYLEGLVKNLEGEMKEIKERLKELSRESKK